MSYLVMTGVGTLSYRQPPPDGGGGTALAVTEGGKKCSLLLILSLEDSLILCSDSNFDIERQSKIY